MKEGSVDVDEGDDVDAGEALGKVGNSGNSTEPHIHFQISDSSDIDELSSIRTQWEDDADPIRGDTIEGFSEDD